MLGDRQLALLLLTLKHLSQPAVNQSKNCFFIIDIVYYMITSNLYLDMKSGQMSARVSPQDAHNEHEALAWYGVNLRMTL